MTWEGVSLTVPGVPGGVRSGSTGWDKVTRKSGPEREYETLDR